MKTFKTNIFVIILMILVIGLSCVFTGYFVYKMSLSHLEGQVCNEDFWIKKQKRISAKSCNKSLERIKHFNAMAKKQNKRLREAVKKNQGDYLPPK